MDFMDKVGGFFKGVGDMADEQLSKARTAIVVKEEEARLNDLYRDAGKILFEKFTRTGFCDSDVRALFSQIQQKKQVIEALKQEKDINDAHNVRTTKVRSGVDASANVGSAGICPGCGAMCVPGTRFCTSCGRQIG